MNKHLGFTCLGYAILGFGTAVRWLGMDAGLGLNITYAIYGICLLSFLMVVFTSMQNLKEFIKNHDVIKQHENRNTTKH